MIQTPQELPASVADYTIQTDASSTLEPNSWLSLQNMSITSDPRETLSQGVRSPTPRPAVAELQSFVRAGQKPRVYTVSRRTFSERADARFSTNE